MESHLRTTGAAARHALVKLRHGETCGPHTKKREKSVDESCCRGHGQGTGATQGNSHVLGVGLADRSGVISEVAYDLHGPLSPVTQKQG
jgi:hypothetical protein